MPFWYRMTRERRIGLAGVDAHAASRTTSFRMPAQCAPAAARLRLRDRHVLDRDRRRRLVARLLGHARDLLDEVDLFALAKDRVLSVQPIRRDLGDEELAAVGAAAIGLLAGVRHRERARLHLQLRVDLVVEVVARAARAGALRIAALDHELRDHAVERQAVEERLALLLLALAVDVRLLAGREADEVRD